MGNETKDSETGKAFKCLGVDENYDVEHKYEKERLKREHLRRLRLFGTQS
jgi:hypothetical protein